METIPDQPSAELERQLSLSREMGQRVTYACCMQAFQLFVLCVMKRAQCYTRADAL